MTVRLTCTQAQYEALYEDANLPRRRYVYVSRQALKALLVDHTRLREAAERAVDVVESKK